MHFLKFMCMKLFYKLKVFYFLFFCQNIAPLVEKRIIYVDVFLYKTLQKHFSSHISEPFACHTAPNRSKYC